MSKITFFFNCNRSLVIYSGRKTFLSLFASKNFIQQLLDPLTLCISKVFLLAADEAANGRLRDSSTGADLHLCHPKPG